MPARRPPAAALAAAALTAALALGGCTTVGDEAGGDEAGGDEAGGDGTSTAAASPTFSGVLIRYRSDIALNRVQVKLAQPAGEPVADLLELRATLPGYADGPVTERPTRSRPGSLLDLPVVLGEPVCPAPGEPTTSDHAPSGDLVAHVTVVGADGPVEVDVPLTDPDLVAPKAWARDCSTRAALAATPLAFGETWVRGGSPGALTASGELLLGPVADGRAVRLVEVVGTTLFSATATVPVDVVAGQQVPVPFTVAAARCDPHAVGESKRGYSFGIRVSVDGGEPALVTVEPPEAAKAQMEAVLLEQCGLD